MDIEKKLKEFGEKVRENPTLLLIPAGAIGGIYLLYKANQPELVEPALAREPERTILSGGGGEGGMSAGSDGTLSQITAGYEQAFNDLSNEYMDFQTNTIKALQETERTFQAQADAMALELSEQQNIINLKDISRIIYDDNDRRDDIQYYSASRDKDENERRVIAGTGNDGKGWANDDTWKDFVDDVRSSSKLKESELERTENVIKNRKELGLSTDRQERYKKQLSNDFKDFD